MGFKKIKYYIFIVVVVAVFLITIDIFCRFLYLKDWFGNAKLLDEIDPIAVITLVVSSIITVYVGIKIVKSFSEERYKKEYLIGELKLIESEIVSFESLISYAVSIDLDDLMKIMNKVNLYIERHSKTLDIFEVNVDNSILKSNFNQIYFIATNVSGSSLIMNSGLRLQLNSYCSNVILESRRMIHVINKI